MSNLIDLSLSKLWKVLMTTLHLDKREWNFETILTACNYDTCNSYAF